MMSKLQAYGVTDDLNWIKYFLCDRHQCTRIGQYFSVFTNAIIIDVMQGSIIGQFTICNSMFEDSIVRVTGSYGKKAVVMRDTDDTTVHRGTKFSRYWYRRGHDTTGYFLVPRYPKYRGIFTVLSSNFS